MLEIVHYFAKGGVRLFDMNVQKSSLLFITACDYLTLTYTIQVKNQVKQFHTKHGETHTQFKSKNKSSNFT